MKKKQPTMDEDIKKYPIFIFKNGCLVETKQITSTKDYCHSVFNLHHYISRTHYNKNKEWYKVRGIQQKLILVPTWLHEQIHNQAICNLSDDEFEKRYKISRWNLLFNRKHTKY